MANTSYEYQKPQNTYTIDQYINCKSDTLMCYYNTSFIDVVDNLSYSTYNVVSDYLDELRSSDYCVTIELTDEQLMKYKYRPKLLCYDIYGNTELHFIIMLINDMYSVKQFTQKTLLMPTVDMMKELSSRIINANKTAISVYAKNTTTIED
jgi:hypothetical protein